MKTNKIVRSTNPKKLEIYKITEKYNDQIIFKEKYERVKALVAGRDFKKEIEEADKAYNDAI